MKKYTCPACGKEQTSVIIWYPASVPQKHNCETHEWETMYEDAILGDSIEDVSCPHCSENLPQKLVDKLKVI